MFVTSPPDRLCSFIPKKSGEVNPQAAMIAKTEFQEFVTQAYQSLYDFVRLRSLPLTPLLLAQADVSAKDRGWQAHHKLLEVIEELYPGAAAPPFSKEWRRHRLLVLRYIEAMDPPAVADQLGISRRQYYREHAAAMEAVADILWERCDPASLQAAVAPALPSAGPSEAIQIELARISQHDAYADLGEVLEGAVTVLDRVLQQNTIDVAITLPAEIPIPSIGHNLMRQVMLGVLGYLVEQVSHTTLKLAVVPGDGTVHVQITTDPYRVFDETGVAEQLDPFQAMLRVGHGHMALIRDSGQQPVGFDLELPLEYDCTVLAADDNEDTLALYKRFLTPNRYRVITTRSPLSVVNLVRESGPDIVILDLMMPEQDGWDLLQILSNRPDTAHIPIVICSVLKQKSLALSLGAATFLEKPFTEQALLAALEQVRDSLDK
jgi:CheY-like chemotaxis protein